MTDQTGQAAILDAARAWYDAGHTPLPASPDGRKRPALNTWKAHQTRRPEWAETRRMFGNIDADGIGVLTGTASGLTMLELEGRAVQAGMLAQLAQLFTDHQMAGLWARLVNGRMETTPSGGFHFHYTVTPSAVRPNTKLASRPSTIDELEAHPGQRVQVLIETRGAGGWTVVAPSAGRTHPTGRAWEAVTGSPGSIPALTVDEQDAIFMLAAMLDQTPQPAAQPATPPPAPAGVRNYAGTCPGDAYNQNTTWDDLLLPDGWTKAHKLGASQAWVRPGKKARDGMSATTGRRTGAEDCLYVFSSAVDLPQETPITKFAYYTLTKAGGDYTKAASQLGREGYGGPPAVERPLRLLPPPQTDEEPAGSRPSVSGALALTPNPQPTAQPDVIVAGLTDLGNAEMIVNQHRARLHYVPAHKTWLTWTGAVWEQTEDDAAAIQAAIETIRTIDDQGDKETSKHIKTSMSKHGLEAAAKLAATFPAMRIRAELLDADPWVLNTPAGLVDLRDGEIRPARPDDWCTRTTAVAPDNTTPTPLWTRFLSDTFGDDQEMIGFVQRLAGYSACGAVRQHVLPFLHGAGGNGKGVYLDVLVSILGDYATTAPPAFLMAGQSDESAIARLSGQRLVVCSEVNQRDRFDEARVKILTGGDKLTARFLYGQYFTFTPTHTLWLMGNSQPRVEAGGESFWRRLRLIPFLRIVPKDQIDEDLGARMVKEEGAGILAWIIEGATNYFAEGLNEPGAVLAATSLYAAEEDSLGRFASERLRMGGGDQVTVNTAIVRKAYGSWCKDNGETEVSSQVFGRELRARYGVQTTRSHGSRFYTGVSVIADTDDDDDPRGWRL